jgi:hypothetical protein
MQVGCTPCATGVSVRKRVAVENAAVIATSRTRSVPAAMQAPVFAPAEGGQCAPAANQTVATNSRQASETADAELRQHPGRKDWLGCPNNAIPA